MDSDKTRHTFCSPKTNIIPRLKIDHSISSDRASLLLQFSTIFNRDSPKFLLSCRIMMLVQKWNMLATIREQRKAIFHQDRWIFEREKIWFLNKCYTFSYILRLYLTIQMSTSKKQMSTFCRKFVTFFAKTRMGGQRMFETFL